MVVQPLRGRNEYRREMSIQQISRYTVEKHKSMDLYNLHTALRRLEVPLRKCLISVNSSTGSNEHI
jgi:hypothetical protein